MLDVVEQIKAQIAQNSVILYMKGSPHFPMCGFSARVVGILKGLNTRFAFVNVLENPDIRQQLPQVANWPTFPQLYIQGELIGGCDIVEELHQSNELQELLGAADSLGEETPEFHAA